MKIVMINGSPRQGKSNSERFLNRLEPLLGSGHEILPVRVNKAHIDEESLKLICSADVLVLAFPLYSDGIPSQLFRLLVSLEEPMKKEQKQGIAVYALINNGFYEGKQNHVAFDILKNWCRRLGLSYGGGVGLGAGEMLGSLEKVPLGKGPLKNLGTALEEIANRILSKEKGDPIFINPNFPRVLWKLSGTYFFWNATAKKNGLTKKDLMRRL